MEVACYQKLCLYLYFIVYVYYRTNFAGKLFDQVFVNEDYGLHFPSSSKGGHTSLSELILKLLMLLSRARGVPPGFSAITRVR